VVTLSSFLQRVRIHAGDCGAVARALHHEGRMMFYLPARSGRALDLTTERKRMSLKTILKRVSLAVVVSLGFGLIPVATSSAAVSNETMTIASASSSINAGETATTTITHTWVSSSVTPTWNADSMVITSSCLGLAASGGTATCPTLNFGIASISDTANIAVYETLSGTSAHQPNWVATYVETATSTSLTAYSKITLRAVSDATTPAGTYTYTIESAYQGVKTTKSVTFTVTVTAPSWSGLRIWKSNDQSTFRDMANKFAAGSDSSTNVSTGKADSIVAVAYIAAAGLNAAGETTTSGGANVCTTQASGNCSIGVVVDGPGLISVKGGTAAKSATLTSNNNAIDSNSEYLVVYSDGTAGVGTIKFYNAATLLASTTVTFTGAISNITLTLSDTSSVVAKGTTGYVSATVKDAAGNTLTTGSIWLWSSDTSIVSETASACCWWKRYFPLRIYCS